MCYNQLTIRGTIYFACHRKYKNNIYCTTSIPNISLLQVLKHKGYTREGIENIADSILRNNTFLHEMYGLGVSEFSVRQEEEKFIPQIMQFVEKYMSPKTHTFGQNP